MNKTLRVMLAELPPDQVQEIKDKLHANPDAPILLKSCKSGSHLRRVLLQAEDKRLRRSVGKNLQKGTPLSEWDEAILCWSAGYWKGKIFQGGLTKTQSKQFSDMHDRAVAELLRRKLVN